MKVVVREGDGMIVYGIGGFGWKKRFNASDVAFVSIKSTDVRVNGVPQKGICLSGPNMKPITFGTNLKERQKEYIAAVLKQKLVLRK